ncbi:hypothetical protein, partial [Mesorhizobium sp. M4B.F.Ca.ET.150.01.1.1]|uniref:ImmA/IrrE family metallo-endopeptidase n=1 Tax=Mesorhizobium sp. M4B.F.Ca.ET.150.01.1.1 TaxID=2563948 RepID=UPI001AEE45B8
MRKMSPARAASDCAVSTARATMPPDHVEDVVPKKRSRVEQLADNFASALLMPSTVLGKVGDWSELAGDELI